MNQKTKRILSGAGAVIVAVALLIGGTYAYTAFDHRSNPFRNDPNYQGRLVEDFEEKEWEVDKEIKKEISVKNMGGTEQFPGKNWGDIFVRVKLKEHMDITPIDYVYYPEDDLVNKVRFMTDKQGRFVRFEATSTIASQLPAIRSHGIWNEVINDGAARAAFTAGLTASNFVRLRGYYDSRDYWYVVTKAGDPNGQYGSFVVVDKVLDVARMESITGSDRATGIDYGSGLHIQDPSEHDNEECLYPTHYWDEDEPELCELRSHDYAKWDLGPSIVMIDDWDGLATDAWILNPVTGWATWGNALKPGESTDLLLRSVTPIRFPDGDMLYVIHADMQCTDRMDMKRDDFWKDDNGDPDEWDIIGIVDGGSTGATGVQIQGGDRTMTEGQTDQLKARVFPPNASNKGVKWRSSNPNVVTVDDDGNIVAVGPGDAVITVTTDDGDFEDSINIHVDPGTVPATDINITTAGPITIEVGQTKTIDYTVVPSDSTDTAGLRSGNIATVSIVSPTQIKGEAVGTTTVYVEAGGISKPITVEVVAATVPATDITLTVTSMTIEVGETKTVAYNVVPSNSTDAAGLSSNNGNVSIVSSTQIKGEAVGSSTVTVTAGSISKTIAVTVVAATPDTLTIDVGATGIEIVQGEEMNIPHTILPPNTNYVPQWTTTPGTGSVTIVNQNGRIRGAAVGTAEVTLIVGSKSVKVNVTVVPAEDPHLPIIGNGTFDMQGSVNVTENYSVVYNIDERDFDDAVKVQDGTIKLSDVLSSNITGLSVTSSNPAVASKVKIGTDKDGEAAIVIWYYGTAADWAPTKGIWPRVYPPVQIPLTLSAPGYQDGAINVNLTFNGSFYG